jgi:hypothetical protein
MLFSLKYLLHALLSFLFHRWESQLNPTVLQAAQAPKQHLLRLCIMFAAKKEFNIIRLRGPNRGVHRGSVVARQENQRKAL